VPFNGSGTFNRVHNWTSDAANGIDINASEMDAEDSGFAAGLSLCVTRDGQGQMAADFLPSVSNSFNLGTSAAKWATLNGVPIANLPVTQSAIAAILQPQIGAETAAFAALGYGSIVNFFYPVGCVDRYVANTGSNDCSLAFNIAFAVCQQMKGGVITYGMYGASGPYQLQAPVNFTTPGGSSSYPITLRGPGPGNSGYATTQLVITHGGHTYSHGFDLTGTQGMSFEDVSIGTLTSGGTYPNTAIFQARAHLSAGVESVGLTRFTNVNIEGYFTVACYYNYGAEDDVLVGCYFYNGYTGGATRVLCYTANNIFAQTSNYQTVLTGSISCIDHQVFGGQFVMNSNNAASDVFYLEAIESLHVNSVWMFGSLGSGSAGCRAMFYVDMTNGASNFCSLRDIITEQASPNNVNYVLLFSNFADTPTGWVIDGVKSNVLTYTIAAAGTSPTMDNFTIRGISETAAHGISWPTPAIIQNSVIEHREMPINAGHVNDTVLIGDYNQQTFSQVSGGARVHTGVGLTFAPGVANGANGWTAAGGVPTQSARYTLRGNTLAFKILLQASSGNLSCSAGATITTLPIAAFDATTVRIDDYTAGTVLGSASIAGNQTITIPVAISATAHQLVISGEYWIS
jgi:hypothetical protein